ncbi:MAG TPA: hypothetical protein VJ793_07815 [Anaerolineae bacterium]|nr:hypothetical protein [Anaerolineae bacterium]
MRDPRGLRHDEGEATGAVTLDVDSAVAGLRAVELRSAGQTPN